MNNKKEKPDSYKKPILKKHEQLRGVVLRSGHHGGEQPTPSPSAP